VDLFQEFRHNITRRHFFAQGSNVVGWAALASLLGTSPGLAADTAASPADSRSTAKKFPPKAKHIIYLHMVGGPPQVDLFDYKPVMREWFDKDLPESIRMGQRLTTMTSGQSRFPVAPSTFKFAQHGESRMWVSEVLPWTAKMVDDLCFVRSMHTEAINHEPAICFMQTGNQIAGRPCLGSWTSYGLGSANDNLPTFVVLFARATDTKNSQAISARLWSAGYLPGEYSGVPFRSTGDAIPFINNPAGMPTEVRRKSLDSLKQLNEFTYRDLGDPEIHTRIQQYELAFRMQQSVPDLTNLADESPATLALYGDEATQPGKFANTVLLARRLVERGVRFVQLYINNWDSHNNLPARLPVQCKDVDQACYGLVQDLKQRGLLDETLVIWGGEFGRTIYSQGTLTKTDYGRDHHPRCFTMWMVGGGIKPGTIYGETDEFSYNIVKDPVHVRDFHATVLRQLGFDHERFTYRYQGLDQKLTGVEPARIVDALIS
jgi:Protein of unknown function (DUF1501)